MIVVPYAPGIAAINRRVDDVADAVLNAVYEDAKRNAPVKVRNSPGPAGALKRSVRKVTSLNMGVRRVYVGTDHWHFVEFGTRPHTILPRRKQALYWPSAGFPRARVNHPGSRANPFMRRAIYQKRQVRVMGNYVEVL